MTFKEYLDKTYYKVKPKIPLIVQVNEESGMVELYEGICELNDGFYFVDFNGNCSTDFWGPTEIKESGNDGIELDDANGTTFKLLFLQCSPFKSPFLVKKSKKKKVKS